MSITEKLAKLDKMAEGLAKAGITIGRVGKSEEIQKKLQVEFIPTASMNVNAAMGGGFPKGRTTIITGDSDSGKTYSCLETIGLAMKRDENFVAGWLESEKSLNLKDLEIFGIDPERFYYYEVEREGAAEKALDIAEATIGSGAVDIYVVNSLKCLTPSEELSKDFSSQQVGLQARLNAKMMRKLTMPVAESNTALILIQHLTTKIGGMIFGDPKILAGGEAIRYGASIIIDQRKLTIQAGDPIEKTEGVKIGVTVKKNHVVTDRFPYVKTEYYGIFGEGTETYLEALQLGQDKGILTSGAWINYMNPETGDPFLDEEGRPYKWNGKTKFRQYCIENPDFFKSLTDKLEGKIVEVTGEELEGIKKMEALDTEIKIDDSMVDIDPIEDQSKKKKKKK